MGFGNMEKIEKHSFYTALAIRKADERASILRGSSKLKGTRLENASKVECERIETISDTIASRLLKIQKSFPDLDGLEDFYRELVKCTIDYESLKKSLGALKWAITKTRSLAKDYSIKSRRCADPGKVHSTGSEFSGRVSSVLKQVSKNLEFLEEARKTIRNFPSIKSGIKTVAIAGFPNVGKTTLLMKITGSKADIQPYAFTTKGINVGYIMKDGKRAVQILDTPGTLNRFERMNSIEKTAFLALKMLAERIIYVFDSTEPYPMEDQEKLYKNVLKLKKKTMVYLSKTDILEKEELKDFSESHKFMSAEEIKKELESFASF